MTNGCAGSSWLALPTPTATPSTGRCGAAPTPRAAPSGPGAKRCTRWRPAWNRPATRAGPGPRYSPRWRSAGITAVGEFHYLHHRPDGTAYDDPNAMGRALLAAAARRRHSDHPARHLLPGRRARPRRPAAAQTRTAAVQRRNRRAVGRAGGGADRHGVRQNRRRHPLGARRSPRRSRGDRRRGALAAPCTSTCPSNRPRTSNALPHMAFRPRRYCTARACSAG